MRVQITRGYRGVQSQEQYLAPGQHDVDPALAAYLVANGHAIALEEAKSEPIRKIWTPPADAEAEEDNEPDVKQRKRGRSVKAKDTVEDGD